MPQNRRKVPFSTKQKKIQLQQKRARKHGTQKAGDPAPDEGSCEVMSDPCLPAEQFDCDIQVINQQPFSGSKYNPNRYNLVFKKEKNSKLKEKLALSTQALNFLPQEELEVSYEEIFVPGSELDMPKRPPWNYSMTKEVLEAREEKYFREYVISLEKRFKENLSHFDMNLETWRQLWRVLEFSDIVLLVTDIRHPVFHFSPALYDYVTKDLKKDMIVVFNKIDLVKPHVVVAWKEYFKRSFPKLRIMYFASYAGMRMKAGKRGCRIGKLHMAIEGSRYLLKLCEDIVDGQVNLSSWQEKIEDEASSLKVGTEDECTGGIDDNEEDFDALKNAKVVTSSNDTSCYREARYKDGVLTIGFVGHPNVGKSSFLNAVLGKKVASVSRTPGHTKHYQTIMLTPTVRLCDCPGLVFPSLIPKPMQVLMGCYPIAQERDPYSVIAFLCERLPVHKILKLQHPNFDSKQPTEEHEWSAYDICTAFARKRGFLTAKSARPDVFRAANNILRMALDGRTICLTFYPPNFFKSLDDWHQHPEVQDVKAVQAWRGSESINNEPTSVACSNLQCFETEEQLSETSNSSSDEDGEEILPSAVINKFDVLAELT